MLKSPLKKARHDAQEQQQQPHAQQPQQQLTAVAFRDYAVSLLASRLAASQHCPQAASLALRPSLQKLQGELAATITNAVQLKQNASLLLLGEPGIGKTLVCVFCACARVCPLAFAAPTHMPGS
jgi:DNA replication protein DnaC